MNEHGKIMVTSEEMIGGCLTEDQSGDLEALADDALAEALAAGAAYYDEARASAGPRPQYLADTWSGARYSSSRNGRRVSKIIIHTMQGSFQSAISWFNDARSQVSAHYSIGNAGQSTQHVGESFAAWHAGNGEYNMSTVGIEHEGFVDDGKKPTEQMYHESARISAGICYRHKLPVNRTTFIGHVNVPNQISVRTDPGNEWDWNKYLALVKHYLSGGADPKPDPVKPAPVKPVPGGKVITRLKLAEDYKKGRQVGAYEVEANVKLNADKLEEYGLKTVAEVEGKAQAR